MTSRNRDRPLNAAEITRAALAVSGIGAWAWESKTGEATLSGPWGEIFGVPDDAIPRRWEEFLAWAEPEHRDAIREAERGLAAGTRIDVTCRMDPPRGNVRWIRLRGDRVPSDGGIRMVGVVEDVTARTEEQLRLRKRDEEYRVLTECALDMIVRTDGERRIHYISRSSEQLLGRSPEEILGAGPEGIHRDDRAAADASYAEILSERGHSTANFRLRHKDGHWVWMESLGHAIRDPDSGELKEVLFLMRDASRRIEAENRERRARDRLLRAQRDLEKQRAVEQEIRRSEALFRELADSTPIAMWISGADGRPAWGNRALLDFTGHRAGERVRGMSRIHPDDTDRVATEFVRSLENRAPYAAEVRIERYDGEYRNCLVTALPRLDAQGSFAGYVATSVDVTDLRRAQTADAEHRENLAHALRVESLDQMALGLAHELHQPLAAISATLGAALRGLSGGRVEAAKLQEMLAEAQAQAIRAGALLEEMREFIRKGASGRIDGPRSSIDVNDVVQDAASLARHEADRRDIVLDVEASDEPALVHANRVQVQQVLINLIQNGLEAMGSSTGGRLRVEIRRTRRGAVEVRVLDEGRGLSLEERQHMFDVFYTTRADGLGMGLAISRSIAEAHGGTLDGHNRANGGAEFTLTLPTSSDRDASDDTATETSPREE